MKKWIALTLALTMALSLAACGGQSAAQTPEDDAADAQTEQQDAQTADDAANAEDAASEDADAAAPEDADAANADAAAPEDAASESTDVAPDDSAAAPDAATPDDSAAPDAQQIANPFTDYATYEEAETAAGFSFGVPEEIAGYNTVSYRVAQNLSLFEVIYANDSSDVTARKAPGGWNTSGDSNEHTVEVVESLAGVDVTCWGEGEALFLAMWTADGYSYSLGASKAMDRTDFLGVVETIIDLNAA